MKAWAGETLVAEATNDAVVSVEGNAYFPPKSVTAGVLRESETSYICSWKGNAQYYDVVVDGAVLRDGAWCYPDLMDSAATRVGRDFAGFVAFEPRHVRIER